MTKLPKLSERLKACCGMSMLTLSRKANVPYHTLTRAASGTSVPTKDEIERMESVMCCTFEEIGFPMQELCKAKPRNRKRNKRTVSRTSVMVGGEEVFLSGSTTAVIEAEKILTDNEDGCEMYRLPSGKRVIVQSKDSAVIHETMQLLIAGEKHLKQAR